MEKKFELYCSTGTNIYKLEVLDIVEFNGKKFKTTDINNNVIFFIIKFKNGKQKKSSITKYNLDNGINRNSTCGGYIFKTKLEAINHALTHLQFKEDTLHKSLEREMKIINKQRENIISEGLKHVK
jgi:hypothetical protein